MRRGGEYMARRDAGFVTRHDVCGAAQHVRQALPAPVPRIDAAKDAIARSAARRRHVGERQRVARILLLYAVLPVRVLPVVFRKAALHAAMPL